jgi:hypothetical protein
VGTQRRFFADVFIRLFLPGDCFAPHQGKYFDNYKRSSALAAGLAMTIPLKFASDFRHCDPSPKLPIEAVKNMSSTKNAQMLFNTFW